MYDLVISGGKVVTAAGEWSADVGIQDGRIVAVAAPGSLGAARRTIDADGKYVLPGLVDAHDHLRDPGYTHKEDFRSGTMAAASAGVTTVMAEPNTDPVLSTPEAVRLAVQAATEKAVVDFAIFAGAYLNNPSAMPSLREAGAIAFDIFPDDPYSYGTGAWIELFLTAREVGLPLCFSGNDGQMRRYRRELLEAQGKPVHEVWLGLAPETLEPSMHGRIIPMAAQFGVPVVLRQVTTPQGFNFLRYMRGAYPEAKVIVETCVHYLFLTAEDVAAIGPRACTLPPPRPASELGAVWQAVRDGTVHFISTDHAPVTTEEKAQGDLFHTPPGFGGLETMLPLLLTARAQGRFPLTEIVRLCCEAPARIFGIYPIKGTIAVGSDADLVLVDLDERWRIDGSRFYSKGDPGPFDGWEVVGRPKMTLVRGRVVMEDGEVSPEPWGQLLTP